MDALPHLIPHVFAFQMFFLLVGHALADYPLQGPYLSVAKNPDRVEGQGGVWPWAMASHALIQGGMVAAITGYLLLGVGEALCHAWIDLHKCKNQLTFTQDQLLHVGYKLTWALIVCSPDAAWMRAWLF